MALGVIGAPAVPRLIGLWRSPAPRVHTAIIQAFARCGDRRVTPYLVEALGAPEGEVREEAARGLWRLADPSAAEALLRVAQGPDRSDARSWAVVALGRLKDRRAIDLLIGLGTTPFSVMGEVDAAAYAALVGLGKPAQRALLAALDDANWERRWYALQTLGRMSGRPVPDDPNSLWR